MENNVEQKENSIRRRFNKKNIVAGIIVAFIVIASAGYSYNKKKQEANKKAVSEKALSFIKNNLVQAGTDVKITKIEKQESLYKLTLSVGSKEIEAYISSDGSKFFPQAMNIDGEEKADSQQKQQAATEARTKSEVPDVRLFVMSQCPYGVQAEKGIIPAIQKLGSKINFKLQFVDYILHGKKEFDENLFQYCLGKENPQKLLDYLGCYAKDGNSERCISAAKINKAGIASCVSETDKEFKLVEAFNSGGQTPSFSVDQADNKKFGVEGSPTLVVNDTVINSSRDSLSFLKAICSGFSNPPSECQAQLSSAAPAPGFGDGSVVSGTNSASCGQ